MRQELVERRIEQANVHRQPLHLAKQLGEILASGTAAAWRAPSRAPRGRSARIISRMARDPLLLEEHVLRATKTDPLCAEAARLLASGRGIRVGRGSHRRSLVGPFHQLARMSPVSSAIAVGHVPNKRAPVEPSIVMTSPASEHQVLRDVVVCGHTICSRVVDAERRAADYARTGPCHARRRPHGWSLRRAQSECRAPLSSRANLRAMFRRAPE